MAPILNQKKFWGGAQHPAQTLPRWEGAPPPTSHRLRHLGRLESRAFHPSPGLHKILNTSLCAGAACR